MRCCLTFACCSLAYYAPITEKDRITLKNNQRAEFLLELIQVVHGLPNMEPNDRGAEGNIFGTAATENVQPSEPGLLQKRIAEGQNVQSLSNSGKRDAEQMFPTLFWSLPVSADRSCLAYPWESTRLLASAGGWNAVSVACKTRQETPQEGNVNDEKNHLFARIGVLSFKLKEPGNSTEREKPSLGLLTSAPSLFLLEA